MLSTTEAEYIATIKACEEILWMKNIIKDLGIKQKEFAVNYVYLEKNPRTHSRKSTLICSIIGYEMY